MLGEDAETALGLLADQILVQQDDLVMRLLEKVAVDKWEWRGAW